LDLSAYEEKSFISLTALEAESPGSGSLMCLNSGEGLAADGIMVGVCARRRDHKAKQEAREQGC
jgi:hypothetical protein